MIILLCDPDPECLLMNRLTLQRQEHQVAVARDCEFLLEYLSSYDVDLVIMDPEIDDGRGWARLQAIRAACDSAGLILTSGKLSKAETLLAALQVADDCIPKPASPMEIAARAQAVRRRCRGISCAEIQTGDVTIDLWTQSVWSKGGRVRLTPTEWLVLETLVTRRGRTVSKPNLLEIVYFGRDEPDLKIIDVFIFKLRRKLQAAGAASGTIATDWGRGYRFAARSDYAVAA